MAETAHLSPRYPIVDAHVDLAYNAVVLGRDLSLPIDVLRQTEMAGPADPKAGTPPVTLPALLKGRRRGRWEPLRRTRQAVASQADSHLPYARGGQCPGNPAARHLPPSCDEREDVALVDNGGRIGPRA